MKNIASIINFVRSVEPRSDDDGFLITTLNEELALCRKYGWRSTVLFQYDALVRDDYMDLIAGYPETEKGLWLEVVQPLCEACGIAWAGRYIWDWAKGCNLLSHYAPEERRRLIDAAFEGFFARFGAYPEVVGCWMLDSVSLAYMYEKYSIKAACICRDQFGTDYMTLWGGYYNGGYYPCKNNVVCPAGSLQTQIGVPVFRMLGPDPIYQYDMGLGEPEKAQQVCTLEPVYADGGGSRAWVDWYLKENYNGKCLSHAYAQFGQENSFGWEEIKKGLPMQFEKLSPLVKSGEVSLMTLGESGKWFRDSFALTPPAAMCTDTDWKGQGTGSLWYNCRNYRVNILSRGGKLWIRDLHLFDDWYRPGVTAARNSEITTGNFNLPVMDGFRFSKGNVRAGIFVENPALQDPGDLAFVTSTPDETTAAAAAGNVRFTAAETALAVELPDGAYLRFVTAEVPYLPYEKVAPKTLYMRFSGFGDAPYRYALSLAAGAFRQDEKGLLIEPEDGKIIINTRSYK